ncbi:hypothetical protein [Streptomyces sp. NPDC002962]|uniref:hypothetical protein n=1 Tax=Streptomyces sp. NPDC002962 TaxID=3364674 RepID=UPI0036848DE9
MPQLLNSKLIEMSARSSAERLVILLYSPFGGRSCTPIPIEQPLSPFGNGGTITDTVWKQTWELTKGEDTFEVLDDIFERALAGEMGAVAELTVLGGTAAILDSYIIRGRGSKEGTGRGARKAPFRATPVKLLARTAGGLRVALHRPHPCRRRPGRAAQAVPHPGAPGLWRPGPRRRAMLGKAGQQMIIDYEWDLVHAADPAQALGTIAKNLAEAKAGGKQLESGAEDVRLRRTLDLGVTSAAKAARALASMSQNRGNQAATAPAGPICSPARRSHADTPLPWPCTTTGRHPWVLARGGDGPGAA